MCEENSIDKNGKQTKKKNTVKHRAALKESLWVKLKKIVTQE